MTNSTDDVDYYEPDTEDRNDDSGMWVCKHGTKILAEHMTDSHLKNAWKMFYGKIPPFYSGGDDGGNLDEAALGEWKFEMNKIGRVLDILRPKMEKRGVLK